jgi:hypothetical protein
LGNEDGKTVKGSPAKTGQKRKAKAAENGGAAATKKMKKQAEDEGKLDEEI